MNNCNDEMERNIMYLLCPFNFEDKVIVTMAGYGFDGFLGVVAALVGNKRETLKITANIENIQIF